MNNPGEMCYLPVFNHGLTGIEDQQTIIMGNIILEKYYLVYDMSPLETQKAADDEYIQIGLGFRNNWNVIREQQYDSNNKLYDPQKKEFDSSISETELDPYDNSKYPAASDQRSEEDQKESGGGSTPKPNPDQPTNPDD